MSSVPEAHKATAQKSVGVFIITCSTSKYEASKKGLGTDDRSGDLINELVSNAGHSVVGRKLISDSKPMIRRTILDSLKKRNVDSVILTGGTGLSPTDVAIEAVVPLLDKKLAGFGELFRKLSFDQIGSAAMLSRADAGVRGGKAIFCLPGSPDAVRLALERLVLPEMGHILRVARER